MPNLLNVAVPAAGTYTTSPVQIRQGPNSQGDAMSVCCEHNFTYGSGGTTLDTYLQTSLNGGTTWIDVVHFSAALANLHTVANVSGASGPTAPVPVTDGGALAANTILPGIVGSWWRLKYIVAGTYAASTLRVDVSPVMVPAGVGSFN